MNSENDFLSRISSSNSKNQLKDRISCTTEDSQHYRLSEISIDSQKQKNTEIIQDNFFYKKFFLSRIKQTEISPTLNRRAINWLISFCWTSNYSQEVLWTSIGYYYAYIGTCQLQKERLTLLLISCVNLALKLFSPITKMSQVTMKTLLNGQWQLNHFKKMQTQIVQLFEFELLFPNLLTQIHQQEEDGQIRQKILFLSELLLIQNHQSLFKVSLLEQIRNLARFPQTQAGCKKEIMKLLANRKISDPLRQKFNSKFDVDQFIKNLLMTE